MEKRTNEQVKQMVERLLQVNHEAEVGTISYLADREFLDCDIDNLWVDFKTVVPKEALNRINSAHGGYFAILTDECMSIGTRALRGPDGTVTTTIDMELHTLKALYEGDEIRIRISVLHMGKRTILTQAQVYRGDELCCWASMNLCVLPAESVRIADYVNPKFLSTAE